MLLKKGVTDFFIKGVLVLKKGFIKKAAILIMAMAAMAGCSGNTAQKNDFEKLKEKGYITVGLDDTFVPMGFKNEKGELVGFDIDMAKEAARRMGIEVKFQSIDWILKETELNSGKIDMIWNGYTISEERKKMVNFSEPYMDGRHILIVPKDSSVMKFEDIEGKSIATQNASTGLDILNNKGIASKLKGGEPVLYDSFNDAFMDLTSGRIEGLVGDEIMVMYVLKQKNAVDQYKVIPIEGENYENGVGVRKSDTELLKKLNEALNAMKKDGTAAKISNEWFGTNIVK